MGRQPSEVSIRFFLPTRTREHFIIALYGRKAGVKKVRFCAARGGAGLRNQFVFARRPCYKGSSRARAKGG